MNSMLGPNSLSYSLLPPLPILLFSLIGRLTLSFSVHLTELVLSQVVMGHNSPLLSRSTCRELASHQHASHLLLLFLLHQHANDDWTHASPGSFHSPSLNILSSYLHRAASLFCVPLCGAFRQKIKFIPGCTLLWSEEVCKIVWLEVVSWESIKAELWTCSRANTHKWKQWHTPSHKPLWIWM